jgi:hypothetical protein
MSEEDDPSEKKEFRGISSYATDVAGNRVSVRIKVNNETGEKLKKRLFDFLDGLVAEYGHEKKEEEK